MTFDEAASQVIARCRELAGYSEDPGVTTRTFLVPSAAEVHRTVKAWMQQAGMHVRVDAAGNLRGVYDGASSQKLLIGSHLDTVPNAGAFDGILGVIIGIALVEQLGGRRLPIGIEVIGFSEEEGVRFSVPFLGSRALVGTLDGDLLERRDARGISVADAIRQFGLNPANLLEAQIGSDVFGYLEFHIEQGPELESLDLPLGVVHTIAGQTRASITFHGQAGHAGTTPMSLRHDALAAAAEWILAVEQQAKSVEGLVATVGQIRAEPGSTNVISGIVQVSLDLRHARDNVRRGAAKGLATSARHIARLRGLTVEWEDRLDQAAVKMDRRLTKGLENAVKSAGLPAHRLTSGAGHDAMILAAQVPAAMLFLRSPGGISHHPKEAVLPGDVAAALRVGRQFLEGAAVFA